MRKALIPMLASLALCGAATTAMVISSAHAQPGPHKPMMVAMTTSGMQLAQNDAPPPPDGAPGSRGMRQRSPADIAVRMKQMCQDHYARANGQLAYLETRLELTGAEQPLFQRWKTAKLAIAHRQADQCAQRPVPQRMDAQGPGAQTQTGMTRPNPADRMARQETQLKQRLADIEAERPALEAFYNSLSPAQKMELDRGDMRGRGDMMRRHMFADAQGQRGPMDRNGPMGRPPGAPDAPPPPVER